MLSKLISALKNIRTKNAAYNSDFSIISLKIATQRLKYLCIIMLFMSIYLFYNDYRMIDIISNREYRITLFYVHIVIFIYNLIYLLAIIATEKQSTKRYEKAKWFAIHLFILVALILAVKITINSGRLNPNIDTYLIVAIFLAAYLPVKPPYAFIVTCIGQVYLLFGLSNLSSNSGINIVYQVNSTVAFFMAFVLYSTFYIYRKNDFVAEKKLIEREQSMIKLFEINPFPLFLVDLDTKTIIKTNKKAIEYYDLNEKNLSEINPETIFFNKEDETNILDTIKANGTIKNYIMEQIYGGGKRSWIMINCELVEYEGKQCILSGIIDITEIKLLESELAKKASIDALTGVMNRMKGMEILEDLYLAVYKENKNFGLIFCDVNSLKVVNDTYGHSEGDKLISNTTSLLAQNISVDDIVFRYGGDEFIILLKEKTLEQCEEELRKLEGEIDKYNIVSEKPYNISLSFGLEYIDSNNEFGLDQIMTNADKKMYNNKLEYYRKMHSIFSREETFP